MENIINQYLQTAIRLTGGLPGGPFSLDSTFDIIAGGGSDRFFLRIKDDRRSIVAMIQSGGPDEFSRYIAIGDFLRKNGIAVPEFYAFDHGAGILLMEDLGSLHLEDALEGASSETELSFYRESMEILFRFQTSVKKMMAETGMLSETVFNEEKLLGETEYFEREFLGRFFSSSIPKGWEAERRRLARELASEPLVFMHRDFQSRNIMIKGGEARLIDFQTAHRGPGIYDAASILKDPYHPVPPGTRKTLLLEFYYRLTETGAVGDLSFEAYRDKFIIAAIQRNLQALAAFAFLGFVKKKKHFLESVPRGIDLLEESVDESGEFPAIKAIISESREKLDM